MNFIMVHNVISLTRTNTVVDSKCPLKIELHVMPRYENMKWKGFESVKWRAIEIALLFRSPFHVDVLLTFNILNTSLSAIHTWNCVLPHSYELYILAEARVTTFACRISASRHIVIGAYQAKGKVMPLFLCGNHFWRHISQDICATSKWKK